MTSSALPALLLSLACAATLSAQDPDIETQDTIPGGAPPASPPRLAEGLTEEQMWRPPTEEDWAKPVLVEFERTWGDAVAVARETNKPILVCINMDGEIASEHYAGVHYRTAETAELFDDYVCVIGSVYRHNPRDYDEQGRRIPCPRFGCVTCGEHIAIEPILYRKFMGGRRISPRHIMVELDGTEKFDVFFAWDNQSIFDTIRDGIAEREAEPRTIVRGDRPVLERVASRAREDREAVEQAYRQGDREMREQLLRQAVEHPDAAPIGLLRLAIFDVDEELARLARTALAKVQSPTAVDLLAEALRVPLPEEEREALVGALERLRDESASARLLANVHRGLEGASKAVDLKGWQAQISGGQVYQAADAEGVENRAAAREAAVQADPESSEALLGVAESSVELALDPATADRYWDTGRSRYGVLLLQDAQKKVVDARQKGAAGWRPDAIEALCEYYAGDRDKAFELAIQAATAMPAEPDSLVAVLTLEVFAEARIAAIWDALRKKEDWPGAWMVDVSSAYTVLANHPLGLARHAAVHYDVLDRLGARRRAGSVLERGLERFPDDPELHYRLRARLLEMQGVDGLLREYRERLEANPDDPATQWFAGYAHMVAAEFQRRNKAPAAADEAYAKAIELLDGAAAARPEFEPTSAHFVALSLSARGRLAIERGELARALELCLQGIERRPASTPQVDGLGLSPVQTLLLLKDRLAEAEDTAAAARLQEVMDGLDPAFLELPEYEQGVGGRAGPGRRGNRGGRGGRGQRGRGQGGGDPGGRGRSGSGGTGGGRTGGGG